MIRIHISILFALIAATVCAQRPVRFNNETADTTIITNTLIELEKLGNENPQKLVAEAAKKFIGRPYSAGTLEGTPEMLTVNVDRVSTARHSSKHAWPWP